jgi:hypothetical protein
MAENEPAEEAGPDTPPPIVLRRWSADQKRRLFVAQLMAGASPPAAYKAAGYVGASQSAPYSLMQSPLVQRALRTATATLGYARFGKDIEWLTKQQLKMAGVDQKGRLISPAAMIDQKTNLPKPMRKWPRVMKYMVKAVKHTRNTTIAKNGDQHITDTIEFQMHDRYAILRDLKAPLEKLGLLAGVEDSAAKAAAAAETGAQRLVAALAAMREANGLAPVPSDMLVARPH